MDMEIFKIEKLADYKKALKSFVRGTIKSKIFFNTNNGVTFDVTKEDGNIVTVSVCANSYGADFCAEVSTRVFNKVTPELLDKVTAQFNKLKNFGGVTVNFK